MSSFIFSHSLYQLTTSSIDCFTDYLLNLHIIVYDQYIFYCNAFSNLSLANHYFYSSPLKFNLSVYGSSSHNQLLLWYFLLKVAMTEGAITGQAKFFSSSAIWRLRLLEF